MMIIFFERFATPPPFFATRPAAYDSDFAPPIISFHSD